MGHGQWACISNSLFQWCCFFSFEFIMPSVLFSLFEVEASSPSWPQLCIKLCFMLVKSLSSSLMSQKNHINIIVCVETVQRAHCRRLLVYRTISTVCLEPCDRTQVTDNGVSSSSSFSSFLFIQPLTHFFSFAPQLFLFSLVYFTFKMLGQIQTCTHFTSNTLQYAGVFTFPVQHWRQHRETWLR